MTFASRMVPLLLGAAALLPCSAQPTYTRDVSRIFQAKCQQCHRENDIAPFALKDYDAAVTWAEDIKRVITDRVMPPWKPVAGYGEFRDSFQLTDGDRQTILEWIAAGVPEGDPVDLPEPVADLGEWALGEPDLVLSMAEEFTPPRGRDVYRCFVMPESFDAARYIGAVDVLPGNRKLVHHVLLFADTKNDAAKLDGKDGQPGWNCFGGPGFALTLNSAIGGWAPGQRPRLLPEGIGIEWPKASRIVMQVHYFPRGLTAPDRTRIGVYFSKTDVQQRLFNLPVVNRDFKIPANAAAHEVNATFSVLPFLDGKIIAVYPHMHLLGTRIKVEAIDAQKRARPLIYIDNWDFNWQGPYTLAEPMTVRAGSRIDVTCTYNNSGSNPSNPNDPIVAVGWGEATTDEMCLAFLGVTLDYEKFLPLRSVNPEPALRAK